ncbi:Coenzyme F420 hydrogenase/dehydrogenase, beta subunit C-terminal domain [Terribacillus sp. DMT04]|uniref:Coenzyme F420 hydrogenase/dehydrogenase, beta subunit C-terminal domain n=1 Tax=Terribacillus sp. DMT04 TaxID=2850441 RepID=UPI001C2BCBC6|nr:Coenzyme F420 hydrogenase/dehydrogenase, beta subunit C-terminal domain [Terribacillus sp. DMT04]QXE01059.1 Coenzyme F420 hydrogenase/dehydrogenase, beta subunit C-terminal domain [Terribacillus sp. DMT04]
MSLNDIIELKEKIISNDYCTGCGICASSTDSPFKMKMNEDGRFIPVMKEDWRTENNDTEYNPMDLCPFSDRVENETDIGQQLFEKYKSKFNEYTGFTIKNYAGYVNEQNFRRQGSSGGMGNWIAYKLLESGEVDGIIHVKETDSDNKKIFKYDISYDLEQLKDGAKSKYYPVELSEVLQLVRQNEGSFALIGIPCFIKGIRLLAKKDPIINERIKYCIGLVCGHLKSDMFAKSIGWQLGIDPKDLQTIDFRTKVEDKPANEYSVTAYGKNGNVESGPTRDLYTTNWGQGYFRFNACEFCDDIVAETADVTVGDAWLPEYKSDSLGTNVIVVRHPIINSILQESYNSNKIFIQEISSDDVYKSQQSGFRHRREGLAYRMYLKDKKGEWRPKKRVMPSNEITRKRKRIYKLRQEISLNSFSAYRFAEENNDFTYFIDYMEPIIKKYKRVTETPIHLKAIRKIKRILLH